MYIQLSEEGAKRIDAFVFELIFRRRLNQIAADTPDLTMSFGWHLGYNKYGHPAYWFRLMNDENDWNSCDDAMLARLCTFRTGRYSQPVKVLRVRYEESSGAIQASLRTGDRWGDWRQLDTALEELPLRGRPAPPKAMEPASPARANAAFAWLNRPEFRPSLKSLSVQRRFMNCTLRPHLGRDGTDLDAVVLTSGGELCALEFKRKYPSVGTQLFGLDKYPHVRTVRTMDQLNIRNRHIFLVSPVWNKNESPLSWLSQEDLGPHWTWLAASLTGEDFDKEEPAMHTSGIDSGQRKAERKQASIGWDKICLLNEGLRLGQPGSANLTRFLMHGTIDGAVSMTYQDLLARRQR